MAFHLGVRLTLDTKGLKSFELDLSVQRRRLGSSAHASFPWQPIRVNIAIFILRLSLVRYLIDIFGEDAKHKFTLIQFEFIKCFASTSLLRGCGCQSGSECVLAVDRVNHELIPAAIHSDSENRAKCVFDSLASSQSNCRHRNHTQFHNSHSSQSAAE